MIDLISSTDGSWRCVLQGISGQNLSDLLLATKKKKTKKKIAKPAEYCRWHAANKTWTDYYRRLV